MKVASNISVVIPAYNAGASIGDVVVQTRQVAASVLVVDDGSVDCTSSSASEAGAQVLRHQSNRGKGAALQTGMDAVLAQGADGVITLDADGQHLPGEIPKLIAAAQLDGGEASRADLVLGSRAHLFTEISPLRRASNRVSSGLISFAAGAPFDDVQTGFRFYSRQIISALGMPGTGFEAESAIVVLGVRRGFRLVSTPVELGFADGRSTSHYRPIADSLRIARAVIGARFSSQAPSRG